MDGPVISIDVSKGESHMRGFEAKDKPFGKVIEFKHDLDGFGEVGKLYERLKEKTGIEPSFIYEATGVYTATLVAYLISQDYQKIYQISPLQSAKKRKTLIRPSKTDALDTGTIMKVFYDSDQKTRLLYTETKEFRDLRAMSRHYQYLVECSVVEKNRYRRCLDDVWPCFDEVIDYESTASLDVVEKYGSPNNVKTAKGVLSVIKDHRTGKQKKEEFAQEVMDYVKNHISGCPADSYKVDEIKSMARKMRETAKEINELLGRMLALAKTMPEFGILLSLPAVADTSALRLLSEIGNIEKFPSAKAFVAYIGIDPDVNRSGRNKGNHLPISKKGNRWLRTTFYLIITNMCRCAPESKIAKYVEKKKGNLSPKAAKIAGCNKLARTMYAMLVNGTCYCEEQ